MEYIVFIDGKELPIRFTTLKWAMQTRSDLKRFERYAESLIEIWGRDDAGTETLIVERRAKVLLGRQ